MFRHMRGFQKANVENYTNHVDLALVTPPAIEPVTLKQMKLQSRITYSDADEILTLYISAARDRIERYLRRALITQQWDFVSDWAPAWVELPKAPLQSIDGVFYTGLDNVEHTVDPSIYIFNLTTSWIGLNIGAVWPLHRGKAGFRIRYTCGYGSTAASVPAAIRKEILSMASQYDDIREQIDLPVRTTAVLRPYRIEGEPFRMARGSAREDILA